MPNSHHGSKKQRTDQVIEFDQLNLVGKAIFVTGTLFKTAETVVSYTVTTLSDIWDQAEQAFLDEHDPRERVSDAVIVEESHSKKNGESSSHSDH